MIWVANDVGSKELAPLFTHHRVAAELTNEMAYADFLLYGNGPQGIGTLSVGVERKALRDLLQCITDSRFSGHQLPGMLETYDVSWLIVEGAYRCDPRSGTLQEWWTNHQGRGTWTDVRLGSRAFMHSELERYLFSLQVTIPLITGKVLHVHRTRRQEETVASIVNLYHLLTQKEWGEHRSFGGIQMPEVREPVTFRARTKVEMERLRRRRVAMCFSGIGQGVSKSVVEQFGSIREMVNADEKEWRKVDGVGKVIARQVVEEITFEESGEVKPS